MIVAGGCYREICVVPDWDRLFGSGGRASVAIASWNSDVELYAYAFEGWAHDAETSFASFGVVPNIRPIGQEICFSYFHPLSPAQMSPPQPETNLPFHLKGAAILRFGFVEGDAVVHAERAVYDPQGLGARHHFHANGSSADELAIVLNEGEACVMAGETDPVVAANSIMATNRSNIVVLKRGVQGATVFEAAKAPVHIPAYQSSRVFKIGSGDVFSGIFAQLWAKQKIAPPEAADMAARAVAEYVESARQPPTFAEECLLGSTDPQDRFIWPVPSLRLGKFGSSKNCSLQSNVWAQAFSHLCTMLGPNSSPRLLPISIWRESSLAKQCSRSWTARIPGPCLKSAMLGRRTSQSSFWLKT